MKGRWLAAGLALAAAGATCGGDKSIFSSGIDKAAELGHLGASEVQKLCDAVTSWTTNQLAPELKELGCRAAALTASGLGGVGDAATKLATCTTAFDQCMKQPTSSQSGQSGGNCSAPPATCTATVGELETCINAFEPLVQQYLTSFPTCQQLGSGSVTLPTTQPQTPASCVSFQTKCQGLALPVGIGTE